MATASYMAANKLADLLRAADRRGTSYVWVLSRDRLGIGTKMLRPDQVIRLSKECLEPVAESAPEHNASPVAAPQTVIRAIALRGPANPPAPVKETAKKYWFEILGERFELATLKGLLAEGLRSLERERPGTLEKLSDFRPRTKRIVSKNRADLFRSNALVAKYSEQLVGEWWLGTNNSGVEVRAWLQRACQCAGLKWDEEFSTSLPQPTPDGRTTLEMLGLV